MKNFKYAYLGITKKLFLSFIIIIQVMAASFMIYSSLKVSNDINQNANSVLNIFNGKKAYYMKISQDFMDKLSGGKFTNEDVLKSYKILKNIQGTHFYCRNSAFPIAQFDGIENFRKNPSTKTIGDTKYVPVNSMWIDKNMWKQFKLNLIEGNDFQEENFEKESNEIPVILGYDYKNKYKVGDTFSYYDTKDKNIKNAKVLGILKQDSYLLYKVDYTEKFQNLNNYIIGAFVDLDKLPEDKLITDYYSQVFDLFNTSYFLFDETKSNAEIEKSLGDINKVFEELNIGKQDINSVDNYLESDKEMLQTQKHNSLIMVIIIVLFLSMGITSSVLYRIKKEKKYYGIHIMNGATLNDICIRVFEEIFTIFLIGFISSIGIIKLTFKSLNASMLIQILLLLVIIAIFISIVPIVKIKKLKISELIKDGE